MSRVALTVQQIDRDTNGLACTRTAPSSTELSIPNNDGRIFIEMLNTGTATMTVTAQTPGQVGGLAIAEYVATVGITTGDQMVGPFPPAVFNQADGAVYLDLSATVTTTIGCFRL